MVGCLRDQRASARNHRLRPCRKPRRSSWAASCWTRIDQLNELREAIEFGLRELDAGLGRELDIEELISQLHQENAGRG